MRIALAQLNFTVGDIKTNADKIIAAIKRAKEQGADLVVFAEFAVSGTPAYGLLTKTTFLTLCEEAVERIAESCNGIAAIVGTPYLTAERTAIQFHPRRTRAICERSYMVTGRVWREVLRLLPSVLPSCC